MIVAKLELFQIKRKPSGRDTVVFDQAFFSPTPETFQSVNVDLAVCETRTVVDGSSQLSAEKVLVKAEGDVKIKGGHIHLG